MQSRMACTLSSARFILAIAALGLFAASAAYAAGPCTEESPCATALPEEHPLSPASSGTGDTPTGGTDGPVTTDPTATCASADLTNQCVTKADGTSYCACCKASEAPACTTSSKGKETCACSTCVIPLRISQIYFDSNKANNFEGKAVFSGPGIDSSVQSCLNKKCGGKACTQKGHMNLSDDYMSYDFMEFGNFIDVRGKGFDAANDQIGSDVANFTGNGYSGYEYVGIGYMDENCNEVNLSQPHKLCGYVDLQLIWSPISFIWKKGAAIENQISYTQFPLNPGELNRWYAWRASDETPLLVFDPQHTGNISSAQQLFGPWTFGGNRAAAKSDAAALQPKPWKDGYEALGTLDQNRDGALRGVELDTLSLWFDSNRNGVSEQGEVKRLSDLGVSGVFYTDTKVDGENVAAARGFERVVNGNVEIGASVDWFSRSYGSKAEALISETPKQILPFHGVDSQTGAPVAKQPTEERLLNGPWQWKADRALGDAIPSGVLVFRDDGKKFSGRALVEIPVKKNNDGIRSVVMGFPMQATSKKILASGDQELRFEAVGPEGQKTVTVAYLSADGTSLKGRSVSNLKQASEGNSRYEYSWSAYRK